MDFRAPISDFRLKIASACFPQSKIENRRSKIVYINW
jgi:hypothetical protein